MTIHACTESRQTAAPLLENVLGKGCTTDAKVVTVITVHQQESFLNSEQALWRSLTKVANYLVHLLLVDLLRYSMIFNVFECSLQVNFGTDMGQAVLDLVV